MKIKLSQEQINFINKAIENTEYKDIASSFVTDEQIIIDDDVAEELRELFADIEIYKLQSNIKDEEFKIASELVDLFCN